MKSKLLKIANESFFQARFISIVLSNDSIKSRFNDNLLFTLSNTDELKLEKTFEELDTLDKVEDYVTALCDYMCEHEDEERITCVEYRKIVKEIANLIKSL